MKPLRALVLTLCLLLALGTAPASADSGPVGVWPLEPEPDVIHGFDPPDVTWGSGHRGVDLAGTVDQPVLAAMAGTVAFVGYIAGKPVVTVSHGETRTTYEPVTSSLKAGTTVEAGQQIGSLELPFSHCFPRACLHWGWRDDDTYFDPLTLVGDGPVRLLPLWRDEPIDHGPSDWQAPQLPYVSWSPFELNFMF